MDISSMDFSEYCCLNRPFLRVDVESDSHWFFGDKTVEQRVIQRVKSDCNVRGVPKFGLLGRWGIGKTHTLNHLSWLFLSQQDSYHVVPVGMQLAPWDDTSSNANNWAYIHRKMMDAIGEHSLRELVVEFDSLSKDRTRSLWSSMESQLKFGDANLKYSLSLVLSSYFLREQKSTAEAWEWLRGAKTNLANLGVNRSVETVQDMVDVTRNIGILKRAASGRGFVFLIDEAHALEDVKKKAAEVHYGFKELADQANTDVGFILALFGGGLNAVPRLLTDPRDILDRMGVTKENMHEAIIELRDVTATPASLRDFAQSVLANVKDIDRARKTLDVLGLSSRTTPELMPFTSDGLDELVRKLSQKEETKAPRMVIEELAMTANRAYQMSKDSGTYVLVDSSIVI